MCMCVFECACVRACMCVCACLCECACVCACARGCVRARYVRVCACVRVRGVRVCFMTFQHFYKRSHRRCGRKSLFVEKTHDTLTEHLWLTLVTHRVVCSREPFFYSSGEEGGETRPSRQVTRPVSAL